jgi:hypothetical protein
MGEWMYKSTVSWPRHYSEVSGQLHALAALPPTERASGTHWIGGWVGGRIVEKILNPTGTRTPTPLSYSP